MGIRVAKFCGRSCGYIIHACKAPVCVKEMVKTVNLGISPTSCFFSAGNVWFDAKDIYMCDIVHVFFLQGK